MSGDPGDLALLADIVLPPPVPFWPPAAGPWMVAASALAMLGLLAWRALRRYRADAYLRIALADLAALPPGQPEAISSILKRVAIVRYGRACVAALTGTAWAAFIAQTAARDTRTDALTARLADLQGPADAGETAESRLVLAQAEAWLRAQRGRPVAGA